MVKGLGNEAVETHYPIVSVRGTAYECGKQHGEQAKSLIQRNVEYYFDYWNRNLSMGRAEAYERANSLIGLVKRYDSELLDEMTGVADGSDMDLETITALNGRYELAWVNPAQLRGGCTSIAALPQATETGVTLLAQNWDYRLALRDTIIILEVAQEGKPPVVMHTEAGIIGHKGMNSKGIGVILNAMVSDLDRLGESVPFLLVCRKMLKSDLFTEALKVFFDAERSVSYNVLIACDGVTVDLEAHPFDVSVITPENGTLTHTNHFIGSRSYAVKDMYLRSDPSTIHRYTVTKESMFGCKHSVESFISILRNHLDYPESVCYHPNPKKPQDHQEETLSSTIMDLTNRIMYITRGPPCQSTYVRYQFSSLKD
jgi:isopenicillin-N N-acyltransferase-like protein